jgi:hypothetical protein
MGPVARSAGRPPSLTKQLALFPTSVSKPSKSFDALPHPNPLFGKLDKLDPRNALPVSTASCPPGSTLIPKSKRDGNSKTGTPQIATNVKSELGEINGVKLASGRANEQSNSKVLIRPPVVPPKPIHKSKPKTPVANIRDRYDRYAAGVKFISPRNASLRRRLTPSTEPLNAGVSVNSNSVGLTILTPLHRRHAAARAAAAPLHCLKLPQATFLYTTLHAHPSSVMKAVRIHDPMSLA